MNSIIPITAEQKALEALNALMDVREAEAPCYRLLRLIQNRSRRRQIVTRYVEHRAELMGFLSKHPAPREFEAIADAIGWFRREIKRQRGLAEHSHWAFSNSVLATCKDRLIVARYFALVEKAEAADRQVRRAA